jgi:bifunctional non-homologous end joining protein LigD
MERQQENAWLLLKKDDKYASGDDVLLKNKSVISRRTLESLEKDQAKQKALADFQRKKLVPERKSGNPAKPKFIAPMLASVADAPFDNDDWIYETKYDGYRTVAVIEDGEVNLFSRNELSFNKNFKPIADALQKLAHNAVIDGEVVVESSGKSDFQSYKISRKPVKANSNTMHLT